MDRIMLPSEVRGIPDPPAVTDPFVVPDPREDVERGTQERIVKDKRKKIIEDPVEETPALDDVESSIKEGQAPENRSARKKSKKRISSQLKRLDDRVKAIQATLSGIGVSLKVIQKYLKKLSKVRISYVYNIKSV